MSAKTTGTVKFRLNPARPPKLTQKVRERLATKPDKGTALRKTQIERTLIVVGCIPCARGNAADYLQRLKSSRGSTGGGKGRPSRWYSAKHSSTNSVNSANTARGSES